MNISQKGIILVLVPLLLQLLVVGVLLQQLMVFNAARLKELQAKRAVNLSLELGFLSAGTSGAIYVYALTGNKDILNGYYGGRKEQAERLRELTPLVKERFGKVKSLEQFALRFDSQSGFEKDFIAEIAAGPQNKVPALFKYATRYFVNMMRSMDDVDRMSSTFNADAAKQALAVSKLWERQKIIVWSGIAASVILAIVLARFFSVGVKGRLSVVESNTALLVQKKPLNLPLGGSDEIGRLDSFFHDMACQLARASQFKRDFYAMVSHDLRNPLSSVRGLIELTGAGAFGQVSEAAASRLEEGLKELDNLLVLINDILDLEKVESGNMPLNLEKVEFPQLLEDLKVNNDSGGPEMIVDSPAIIFPADKDRLARALSSMLSGVNAVASVRSPITLEARVASGKVRVELRFEVDRTKEALVRLSFPGGVPESSAKSSGKTSEEASGEAAPVREARQEALNPAVGIGLNLARLVVDLHGGTTGAEIRPEGEASVVWLEIPERGAA